MERYIGDFGFIVEFPNLGRTVFAKGDDGPPPPSAKEQALSDIQYENAVQQNLYYKAMEPFILREMGYAKEQKENPAYMEWAKNRDAWVAARLPLGDTKERWEKAYETISAPPTQYTYNFSKISDADLYKSMSELEKSQYDINKLALDRQRTALEGKLPISPAMEENLIRQRAQLMESLSRRLGPGWETSTPGIQAIAEFDKKAEMLREEARRGQITSGEQIVLSGLAGAREQSAYDTSQASGIPMFNANVFGSTSAAMSPLYNQRMKEYDTRVSQSMQGEANRYALYNSLIGAAGTGAGLALGKWWK